MSHRPRPRAYRSARAPQPSAPPLSTADVGFYEVFDAEEAHLRAFLPSEICAFYTSEATQSASAAEAPAPLISIRTQSRIPPEWTVQALLTRSTGTDHVVGLPIPAIGHLPEYCSRAVAEAALLSILALLRRLPAQLRHFATFDRDGLTGSEALGRTLAVFGVGHIGGEIAALGRAIGMEVVGVDPRPAPDVAMKAAEEALALADVVVVAMDLNPSTVGYFDAGRLTQLRPGAVLVNISRGEITPAAPLLDALNSGRLSGVAIDTHDAEAVLSQALRTGTTPSTPRALAALELAQHPAVLATPHNAFNTAEALYRKTEQTVRQVVAWRSSGAFVWPV